MEHGWQSHGLRAQPRATPIQCIARTTWTRSPWAHGIAAMLIALAAAVPPLEITPIANTLPMSAIELLGLAFVARDGLAAAFAMLVSLAVPEFLVWVLPG